MKQTDINQSTNKPDDSAGLKGIIRTSLFIFVSIIGILMIFYPNKDSIIDYCLQIIFYFLALILGIQQFCRKHKDGDLIICLLLIYPAIRAVVLLLKLLLFL